MGGLLPSFPDSVSAPFSVDKMSKIFEDGTDALSRNFGKNLPIDPAQHPRIYTKAKA
jgi:hypothetical protein